MPIYVNIGIPNNMDNPLWIDGTTAGKEDVEDILKRNLTLAY